jgi:hypothetical protein
MNSCKSNGNVLCENHAGEDDDEELMLKFISSVDNKVNFN